MRPPTVVMINEHGERVLQMPCTQDQEPIQAFGSSGPDEPLGDPIGLGCLNRRPYDSDVFGLEDGIEAVRELAIAISDQKTNRFRPFGERPGYLPRLLRDPFGVGVSRASGKMDTTAGDFDEEQHVQPLKPDGVDREKIHGDDALRLRAQEFAPCGTLVPACWPELFLAQDLLDRGGRYDDAEAFQLAHNALIAPPWVFPCQANDQHAMLFPDRRTTWRLRIGPALRHHPAVPTQERCRRDQTNRPVDARQ